MCRTLLAFDDELPCIGIIAQAVNGGMDMIRHKAVDQNCETFLLANAQKLREHEVDCARVRKPLAFPIRAEGQGITLLAEIWQVFQPSRPASMHVPRRAMRVP